MTRQCSRHTTRHHTTRKVHAVRASAFSLVELLTVIFIMGALIAILVPSLSAARNAAKKTVSQSAIKAIEVGLEMFKNENEKNFRRTNGYPPSFAHPKIGNIFDPNRGEFPFLPGTELQKPVVYGAHWLPAMLIGPDAQGYIRRSNVPKALRQQPNEWYRAQPNNAPRALDRDQMYIDPEGINLVATNNLPGKRPSDPFFPDWTIMRDMPVIADAFDYPVLYYVANRNGKTTNMVEDVRNPNNNYSDGPQQTGVPYYFHEDNAGFTGTETFPEGWNFQGEHPIHLAGDRQTGDELFLPDPNTGRIPNTFARWIIDRNVYKDLSLKDDAVRQAAPLRPVNQDTFILLSPGVDGKYGTNDDISNIPKFIE